MNTGSSRKIFLADVTAMAETFLAINARPIGGSIVIRVVYSPPITRRARMRRKANHVSEDEKKKETSSDKSGIASDGMTQDNPHIGDSSEDEESVEDQSADHDGEDDDAHHPSAEDVLVIREINMGLAGVLSLHYQARDVRIPVDGDSAMRILTMFKTGSDERWKDDLDPRWSSAASGWVVLDIQQLLAMSYYPQTPPRGRTAVDPH